MLILASGGDNDAIVVGTSTDRGDISEVVVADISAVGAGTSGVMVEDILAVWGADAPVK